MNTITMTLQVDHLILEALKEDISSEDVSTNAVMKEYVKGEVELICKQDGIIAGLDVYRRVFELLDDKTETEFYCKDGDEVKNGQLMGKVTGDIRILLSARGGSVLFLPLTILMAFFCDFFTPSVKKFLKIIFLKKFAQGGENFSIFSH